MKHEYGDSSPDVTMFDGFWGCGLMLLSAFILMLIAFAIVAALSGCSPKYIEKVETKIDTVYVNITKLDTIKTMITRWMWKDSVLTAHVDTVTMKLWYRVTVKDTLILRDTLRIYTPPAIVEKTTWEKIVLWAAPFVAGGLIIMIVVFAIQVFFIRKI